MHTILLRRVTFSNLLSYGNGKHEVRFDDNGLTWIRGSNGAGKSTLIEALTFAFFGSAYRKGENGTLQLKKLINTANIKGKLIVEVEFERIDSKSHEVFLLTRQLTRSGTSSFKYKKKLFTDAEYGKDEAKGAGTTQSKIESEILGFNKNIFENVISLNTIQRDPIIEMKPAQKRKLIESILTLNIDKFKDSNGKALKQAQTKFDAATSDVEKYLKDVNELQVIISQMEKERADDIKELELELEQINSDIEVQSKEHAIAQSELDGIINDGKCKKAEFNALGDIDLKIADLGEIKVLIPQLHKDEKKLVDANKTLTIVNGMYAKMCEVCESFNQDELIKSLDKIKADIVTYTTTIQSKTTVSDMKKESMDLIQKKVTELKSGVPCSTCGKPSTDSDIKTIKDSYRSDWVSINNEYKQLLIEIQALTDSVDVLTIERDKVETQVNENIKVFDERSEYWGMTVQPAEFAISSIESDIKDKRDKIDAYKIASVEEVEANIKQLEFDKVTKDTLATTLSDLRSKASTLTERVTGLVTAINTLKSKRDVMINRIETKRLNTSKDSFTATKDKLAGANHDLETAHNRVDKYSDQISINQYIAGMYADDGIKKLVLGIFVPNLNRAIADNLVRFNLPYTLKFTDSMDMEFSSRFGMADSYYGLSEGQKRKINFAVALALREFVSKIADFKMNVLFLDEVLDISTDPEAYVDMVTLLKDNITIIGNVYMITHRGDLVKEQFDDCIEFTNDGRYSSLHKIDLSTED